MKSGRSVNKIKLWLKVTCIKTFFFFFFFSLFFPSQYLICKYMYILLLHEGYSINYLGVSVSFLCYIIITYNIMHHVDKTVIKHIRVYHASVLFRTFYDVKSRPTQKVF